MSVQSIDIRWPAERFYWARISAEDVPGDFRPASRRRQLEFLLEPELPVSLDTVHAVFEAAPDRSVIICAIARDQVPLDSGAVSLSPTELPAFLETDLNPTTLNLLSGPLEAKSIKRSRSRRAIASMLAIVFTAALVTLGMHRRASAASEQLRQREEATSSVYRQIFPDGPGSQPMGLRLLSERRLLEQTRTVPQKGLTEIVLPFENLIRHWPAAIESQTRSLVVTDTVATLVVLVNSNEDAQRLADSLDASPRWRVLQPQTRPSDERIQLTLRLEITGEDL